MIIRVRVGSFLTGTKIQCTWLLLFFSATITVGVRSRGGTGRTPGMAGEPASSRQCFASWFWGLLAPNPESDPGFYKNFKKLNHQTVYSTVTVSWVLSKGKSYNYKTILYYFQAVLRNTLDPDPDSEFWLDPHSVRMNLKHCLQEEDDKTFILNIKNLTREDRGLYR